MISDGGGGGGPSVRSRPPSFVPPSSGAHAAAMLGSTGMRASSLAVTSDLTRDSYPRF